MARRFRDGSGKTHDALGLCSTVLQSPSDSDTSCGSADEARQTQLTNGLGSSGVGAKGSGDVGSAGISGLAGGVGVDGGLSMLMSP